MAVVRVKAGRERSLLRRHPWLLSGAIEAVEGTPEAGDPVELQSAAGEPLGWGDWSPHSAIRVRVLAFGKEPIEPTLVEARVARALARRAADPALTDTDAVRLINAEGDGLPGVVVDRYADTVVLRISTAGMQRRLPAIAKAVRSATGASCGLARPDPVAARRERLEARAQVLWGERPAAPVAIREGTRHYGVDTWAGQKTGFYLDGRLARATLEARAGGARVLDLFGYTGGYAVAAAAGGASEVTVVDSSAPALEQAERHLEPYRDTATLRVERADAFEWIRRDTAQYDLLVIDPPPLARRKNDAGRASRAYKDVLLHALRRAAPDAELVAFSCSHYVGPDLFRKIAFGASIDAGRSAQVIEELGAPSDHPVSLDHPEGRYFTGLWLRV